MNKPFSLPFLVVLALIVTTVSGCELIGDIFRAGIWVGVIAVIVVVGLVLFVLRALTGRR
jgi:hypothetical protein